MWQKILEADQQLLLFLNQSWGVCWDTFFYWMSNIPIWLPLYALLLAWAWKRGGAKQMLYVLLFLGLAIVLSDQICNFFKTYAPKFRPSHNPDIKQWVHTIRGYTGGPFGTVSGHSANSFLIATFTAQVFRNRWYTIAILIWAATIAFSRMYIGVHFPMDILLGTTLGLLMGWGSYRLYGRFYHPALKP